MNKGTTIPWQDLPTVVELTEDGARKQQTARKMAEMLDDTLDSGVSGEPVRAGGWSVDALVRDFRFGGEEVPTIVASAAPLLNLAHALRHTDEQPDIEQLRRTTTEAIDGSVADCAGAVAAGASEGASWDQAGVKARQSAEASKVRVKTGTAGRLIILVLSSMVVVVASRLHRHGAIRAGPV